MKKKLLNILVCGVLLVGLTGCGNMTKEQMEEKAKDMSLYEISNTLYQNKAKAQEYKEQIYKLSGYVRTINTDYAVINIGDRSAPSFNVYFSSDDLAKLNKNEKITFIGKIDELSDDNSITIKNAYYIDNKYQITGKIEQLIDYFDGEQHYNQYKITIPENSSEMLYEKSITLYVPKKDNISINTDKDITISGNIVGNPDVGRNTIPPVLRNFEIIE